MQLVEQGALSLDAPVSTIPARLPPDESVRRPDHDPRADVASRRPHARAARRQLLRHTSPSLAATVASLNTTTLVYKPGTHTKYSNAGIAVVGDVLERRSSESFYPYLKRAVLAPLGLDDSAFEPLPELAPRLAKANMWTSTAAASTRRRSSSAWARAAACTARCSTSRASSSMLFARGQDATARVLTPATLDTMWTPQFAAAGRDDRLRHRLRTSARWTVIARIGHGGAIYGFATEAARAARRLARRRRGRRRSMASNAVTDRASPTRRCARCCDARAASDPRVRSPRRPVPAAERRALAGRYVTDGSALDLTVSSRRRLIRRRTASQLASRIASAAAFDGTLRMRRRHARAAMAASPSARRIVLGRRHARRRRADASRERRRMPKPARASPRVASLDGRVRLGSRHSVHPREDGQLNALIEWFFEYPLERVSRDVFAFPEFGLYDGGARSSSRVGADGRAHRRAAARCASSGARSADSDG